MLLRIDVSHVHRVSAMHHHDDRALITRSLCLLFIVYRLQSPRTPTLTYYPSFAPKLHTSVGCFNILPAKILAAAIVRRSGIICTVGGYNLTKSSQRTSRCKTTPDKDGPFHQACAYLNLI